MKRIALILALAFLPTLAHSGGTVSLQGGGSGAITFKAGGTGSASFQWGLSAPTGLGYTASSYTYLTASWNSVLTPAPTSYTVQVSTASDFTGTLYSSDTANTSATIVSLSTNTSYYGRVQANVGGPFCTCGISTATRSTIPAYSSTWTVSETSVCNNWASNTNPSDTQYLAQLSTVSNFNSGTTYSSYTYTNSSTFTTTGGTTYYMRVASINKTSIASDWLNFGSTVTSPVSSQVLLGNNTNGSVATLIDNPNEMHFTAAGHTAVASGVVKTGYVQLQYTAWDSNFKIAIYDNSRNLLAASDQGTINSATNGWVTVNFSGGNQITINSGTAYYIAVVFDNYCNIYSDAQTWKINHSGGTVASPENPLGAGTNMNMGVLCLYVKS